MLSDIKSAIMAGAVAVSAAAVRVVAPAASSALIAAVGVATIALTIRHCQTSQKHNIKAIEVSAQPSIEAEGGAETALVRAARKCKRQRHKISQIRSAEQLQKLLKRGNGFQKVRTLDISGMNLERLSPELPRFTQLELLSLTKAQLDNSGGLQLPSSLKTLTLADSPQLVLVESESGKCFIPDFE